MKKKKLSLELNKQVIDQLDQKEAAKIKGGVLFTTIWGSNCNNSDPNAHQCCTGVGTISGACTSTTTVNTELCSPA